MWQTLRICYIYIHICIIYTMYIFYYIYHMWMYIVFFCVNTSLIHDTWIICIPDFSKGEFIGSPSWKRRAITVKGHIKGISWGYHGDIMGIYQGDISWGYQGISWDFMGISWGYHGDIMGIYQGDISWGYQGDIMGFHGDIMGISWGYIMGIYLKTACARAGSTARKQSNP